ncbi:MAG: hypothetical protein B7Z62_08815 [Deltaproteobacteria bacterium 37-65-8]|nr:MAG: hypothetical protein B7Z62_08815 [Deltaproteobacteria bacterium 37-65-8]
MNVPVKKIDTQSEINRIATALIAIKASEDAIKQHRIKLEEDLLALVAVKEEGSTSTETDLYKVKTTQRLIRKVDWDEFHTQTEKVSPELRPFKMKPELDLVGLRYLEINEPEIYRLVIKAITTTPAKVGVVVERLPE